MNAADVPVVEPVVRPSGCGSCTCTGRMRLPGGTVVPCPACHGDGVR